MTHQTPAQSLRSRLGNHGCHTSISPSQAIKPALGLHSLDMELFLTVYWYTPIHFFLGVGLCRVYLYLRMKKVGKYWYINNYKRYYTTLHNPTPNTCIVVTEYQILLWVHLLIKRNKTLRIYAKLSLLRPRFHAESLLWNWGILSRSMSRWTSSRECDF